MSGIVNVTLPSGVQATAAIDPASDGETIVLAVNGRVYVVHPRWMTVERAARLADDIRTVTTSPWVPVSDDENCC